MLLFALKLKYILLQFCLLYLIEISKNLNFIYCFKINGLEDNISEIFQKVFEHVILKFKLMNPELYEKAKAYGLKIINAEAKK